MNTKRILAIILLITIFAGIFTGCGAKDSKKLSSIEDFENGKVGVLTGSSFDLLASEYLPDAEKLYYMNIADLILNLKQEKIDGILMDMGFYTPLMWEGEELTCIEMDMPATEYGIAFPKTQESEPLKAQINTFIYTETENGDLDALKAKWFSNEEPEGTPDFSKLTGENGTLRIAVSLESKPFTYSKNGQFCGFDADFIYSFAEEYGYALEIDAMDFGALLPSLAANRYDLAIASITVTEERKESATFSDIYCRSPIVMAVAAGETEAKPTLDDFENATLGILSGSSFEKVTKERFPDAERQYYSLVTDMLLAMSQGKIDGFVGEITYLTAARWEGLKIAAVDGVLQHSETGYIFQKGGEKDELRQQIDEFILKSKEDGLIDSLKTKWFADNEPTEFFDMDSLTGENGTIKVAVCAELKPVCYMKNGEIVGYEIELLQNFAKEYGYDLEFVPMAFDGILPGVLSGKYDMGSACITITEERAESVDFSESYVTVDIVMIINDESASDEGGSFFADMKEDFEKTFIREDRWKMIAQGIGVTVLISMCALVLGTALGFGLFMLGRTDNKAVQKLVKGIAKVYSRIIAGTPVVVVLMILFYIIFGSVRDMSGIVVAIIGFTLTFGAFVYDHMTVSVGSVEKGQTEAAYALGYTKNQTFFRIIFPQAMKIFMPSYSGQAVELIKATAVVGYIAVNDLTKMGDIIRSNTYEAFFPLIATAVIYFVLTWILSSLLNIVKLHYEPKRRSAETILKGVKTK